MGVEERIQTYAQLDTFGQPGSGPVTETDAHGWAALNGAVRSEGSLPALPLADLDGQFALVAGEDQPDEGLTLLAGGVPHWWSAL